MITVVYAFISYIILPDTNTMLDNNGMYAFMNPWFWVSMAFNFIYMIGYTVFIYPSTQRLIYLLTDNKSTENWYKKGLKGYWWRGILVGLLVAVITMVILMPFAVITVIFFAISVSYTVLYVMGALMAIITVVVMTFSLIASAAVYAEEDFSTGFSHMFKAWKKYFMKVLPISLLALLPTVIIFIVSYSGGSTAIGGWSMVLISFFSAIVGAFASVYCMLYYTEYKNEKMVDVQE